MSFSIDTKNELARINPEKRCCRLAEIAGFIRVSWSVRRTGRGRLTLALSTENPAIARHYKTLMKDYFGVDASTLVGNANFRKKGHIYELCLDEKTNAEQVLRETGVLLVHEGCSYIGEKIYSGLLKTKCCRKAFLRGVFLGAGTLSDPEKGYHLEIVCGTDTLGAGVKKLFNSFVDIHAGLMRRKNHCVVYLKDSEQISDMLNIMGAHSQLLKFENVRIVKELRNRANRINNCDNANMDKALRAAEGQIARITELRGTSGFEALPEKLRLLALARLENPDVSLAELGELLDPPLKKSSVYHYLKKIAAAADGLPQRRM